MKTTKHHSSRRNFLKTAVVLPAGLSVVPAAFADAQPPAAGTGGGGAGAPVLPRRQMGKSGPQVTMLCMGGMMGAMSPDYLDIAWSMGIRYFDNADCYVHGKSESFVARWLAKYPERRKEIFLVTKDHPHKGPKQLLEMVDKRLAACGTDYLDAFYIHGIGPREYGEDSLNWPKSDEFKATADKLKSSGKVKMVGFSCHDGMLNEYLNAAAQGDGVDVIMFRYTPFFKPGDDFDRAVSACHDKGIALVAMKTMRNTSDVPKRLPQFDKLGLTVHQAMLHAVWSDPRISVVCNMIDNIKQMESSTSAARSYKQPLKSAQLELLRQTVLASRRTLCPGCPACDAFAAQSSLALMDIARYVTYYEQDGQLEARDMYQALPSATRDTSGIDLAGLRDRCAFRIDYPDIVRRAEQYFG